ncbi:MAG: TIGR00269 family protein [Thaumarchaeota archaeon]|nr:TIGR00269 family protein [Nitrososphaerota archaeon]MDE1867858.1 TIGR00269 family protein [Nitrososphaerota archaeon]
MKCDWCENTVVYSRKYSGENLCSSCFSKSIVRKTIKTISKYKMINSGDVVGVAVSGGKDSLSLLYILKQISLNHNFTLKAITIDEGIPGYRDEALEIVNDFCNKIQVEHNVYSYEKLFGTTLEQSLEIREKEKISSCSICGILRRRAIDFGANKLGVDVVATGHNLDDFIQTFIINLLSGDVNKISWMDPELSNNKTRKIKPFCEIYENEIVFYAFTNKIPFQSEECPHMNEGIRTEIRNFLNLLEKNHIGIKNNMYRSILKVSSVLKDETGKKWKTCSKCGSECTGDVCSVCSTLLNLGLN